MSNDYDAIVVGARCAGSPTAMLLARRGYRVLVVDRASFPSDTMSTHFMNMIAVGALKRLGVLDDILAAGFRRITRHRAWIDDCCFEGPAGPPGAFSLAPRRIVLDAVLLDHAVKAGARFEHVPVSRDTRAEAEECQLALLAGRFDLVVLARYMQVLSGDFLERAGAPVINIHRSFLPAFAGAGPYERARDRGVKLIGATAHYVTEELDAGPIVDQDVQRVGHGYTVDDLVRVGRDLERVVLARAVRSHLDDHVIVHDGRTIVF